MPKTQTVNYDDGETRAALTVRASTQEIEMQRAILRDAAQKNIPEKLNAARFSLWMFVYPDMAACTIGEITVGGQSYQADSLPFEVFCGLPGILSNQWNEALSQVNTHWYPVVPEEAKKGQPPSTGASAGSSSHGNRKRKASRT